MMVTFEKSILLNRKLYKVFALFSLMCLGHPTFAAHPEIKSCKSALMAQLNGQNRKDTRGCPISQKLVNWLGIARKPEQYSPKELISFLKNHPHWPQHQTLCKKAEDVIVKSASPQDILAFFDVHPPQTPEGVIKYAKALHAQNRRTKAVHIVESAWKEVELSRSQEKKFLSALGHLLQEKHHISRLSNLLWQNRVEEAKRLLPHVPISTRKVAEARIAFLMGKPNALSLWKALPQKSQQIEGLLFEVTKFNRKQDKYQEASRYLITTTPSEAHAAKWWKERNYIARELIALKDYQGAYSVLTNHNIQPGQNEFAEAEWLLGWLALRFLNRPNEALVHFTNLNQNVKGAVSKARGAYWIGRVHETQRNMAQAEKAYREAAKYKTIFYGQLAASKLQEKPYPNLAQAPKVTPQEKKTFHQKDLVQAAQILSDLGSPASHELSKFLLQIAAQSSSRGERELAVHFASSLSKRDSVWAAKKAGYEEPVLLSKAFPVCKIPRKGQGNPEDAFVYAIACQESRFDPQAKSSAGAIGLMQVLPKTAAHEAKRLGIRHSEKKLYEPEHNLVLGSAHLNRLLSIFDGSYILAAAAYNAGPQPVHRWLRDYGDPRTGEVDVIDWIELCPYYETRNYMMRVLEFITPYRTLSGHPKHTLVHDLQR